MNTDQTTTTLTKGQVQAGPNSLMLSDNSKLARNSVWPAIALLALVPTANIQMSNTTYWSSNVTCVQTRYRREEFSEDYEVYSSWYMPRWEDAQIPRLRAAGHIHATFKFQGRLKWLPYEGF
jgi:hypothetical protein